MGTEVNHHLFFHLHFSVTTYVSLTATLPYFDLQHGTTHTKIRLTDFCHKIKTQLKNKPNKSLCNDFLFLSIIEVTLGHCIFLHSMTRVLHWSVFIVSDYGQCLKLLSSDTMCNEHGIYRWGISCQNTINKIPLSQFASCKYALALPKH